MRREGFEMTVSPPKVLYQQDESGNKLRAHRGNYSRFR